MKGSPRHMKKVWRESKRWMQWGAKQDGKQKSRAVNHLKEEAGEGIQRGSPHAVEQDRDISVATSTVAGQGKRKDDTTLRGEHPAVQFWICLRSDPASRNKLIPCFCPSISLFGWYNKWFKISFLFFAASSRNLLEAVFLQDTLGTKSSKQL